MYLQDSKEFLQCAKHLPSFQTYCWKLAKEQSSWCLHSSETNRKYTKKLMYVVFGCDNYEQK